jgi:hypothetical protein
MLTHGTHVKAGSGFGIIVSISPSRYGVKFGTGEVEYFLHKDVSI